MITPALVVACGAFYLFGQYERALLLIVLSIISGAGAAVMAVANPDWYFAKRMQAGLDIDLFSPNKHITSLAATKIIIIAALVLVAWHIAQKAGYL
jgi:hypothetical protein